MTAKRYRFHGNKNELQTLLKLIPPYNGDRVIEPLHPIYQHMSKHLGVEVYEVCLSKSVKPDRIITIIKAFASNRPTFLWSLTTAKGVWIDGNYTEDDPNYPGPFGALCKVHHKSYWNRPETIDIQTHKAV